VARYTITNGQGGQDSAYVQVIVTKDAKPVYPTAIDQVVQSDQAAGKSSVKVNVLDGAVNPSDLVNKLKVGLTGPNAKYGTVGSDGDVQVKPQHERIAVAYTLTDPATGLAGEAFIVVPPASDGTPPPKVKVPQQIVSMNGTKTWKLSDIIDVPSGRPAKVTGRGGVSITHSSSSGFVDDQTLTFTAEKDYRGPAAITFKVDDGREPGASDDRVTSLVLPITVGNPDQSDVPPTFTPPNVTIEAGENPTSVDLRASSFHPNPDILNKLTYTDFSGASGGIVASPSGSTLSISAPFGVQPGTTATIHFKVNSPTTSIDGSVNVKVVSSTRPLAQQKGAPFVQEVQRGHSVPWNNATSDQYWVNPFPGQSLTITNAKAVSAPSGVTVSFTGSSINVAVGSGAAIGTVNIQFNVQDATKDPARTAATIGQYNVVVHDVPAQPAAPSNVTTSSGQATMTVRAPADNGQQIDQYQITDNHGGTYTGQVGSNTIKNLTNGTTYTFQVRAHNKDGWGPPSGPSQPVTPYGQPSAVRNVTMNANGTAPNSFDVSWPAVSNTGGGSVTYHWSFSGGGSGTTKGTSVTTRSVGAGNYSFSVYAVNDGGGGTGGTGTGNGSIADPQPAAQTGPDNAHSVTCQVGGGTCHYFLIKGQHFSPGQQYTVQAYCGSSQLSSPTVTADGNGNIDTSSYYTSRKPNCGTFETGYIIIGGVRSPTVSF
jgi:hypothetical protein